MITFSTILQEAEKTEHPKEYRAWLDMIRRCHSTKSKDYKAYGKRGIAVCDEWKNSFNAFFKDIGSAPDDDYTIERIDNEKGYTKDNVKWATRKQQANNRRNSPEEEDE